MQRARRAFVAGSGYDLFGTSRVGLRTYWHNRVGLALPPGAPEPERQSPGLAEALPWLARLTPESLPAHGIGRQPSVTKDERQPLQNVARGSGALLHGSAGISADPTNKWRLS